MVPHRSPTKVHVEICVAALDAHQTVSARKQDDDKVKMSGGPHFRADTTYSKGVACPNPGQWLRAVPEANYCSAKHFSCREVVVCRRAHFASISHPHKKIQSRQEESFHPHTPDSSRNPDATGLACRAGWAASSSSADSRCLKVVSTKSFPKVQ